MGIKPPLPALTESSTLQTSGGSVTGTDLATDLSRRTDRTSYSIPEDGSPVIISTKKRKDKREREHEKTLTRAAHQSQTSLLIEYFEGGKGSNVHSRPSVRVKVTPSSARKAKETNEHIQITAAGSGRKPSYTRRISLRPKSTEDKLITEYTDDRSISSYTSAAEDSSLAGRYPVDIEVMHRDQGSDISVASMPRNQRYVQQNPSEISSMPPDSMLEGNLGNSTPRRNRSRSLSRGALVNSKDTLKTPSRRRSRSLSRERLAQKVVEKLEGQSRNTSSGKRTHRSKNRSRSVSAEQLVDSIKSPKRRSSRHKHDEELVSGVDSSILTNSQLSPRRTSGDQYSFRSGTSKSSLNNPKLLDTVEDAIRRLILPELTTLRHEQKMQKNRNDFERNNRDPVASASISPRGEFVRRVSKHASAPDVSIRPQVVLNRDENNVGLVLSGNSIKGRKESKYDQTIESPSDRSFERDMSEETVIHNEEKDSRRKSKEGHRVKDAAAGGITGAIITSAALNHYDSNSSIDKRERRRRRSKSHSRSASIAESTDEIFNKHDIPPMPMRSEIYGSDVTRDSILSERTEEPPSPSERRRAEIRQVSRGSPREVLSPASRTPTRTPVNLRKGLGTHHSNLSRGDLSIHSTHSDDSIRNQNRRSMTAEVDYFRGTAAAGTLDADHLSGQQDHLDAHGDHTYAHRARNRGLSPIQSVASYKEESDLPNRDSLRQTYSSGSISSLEQQHGKASRLSINSLSSAASTKIARSNRPKGINLENEQDVLDQHAELIEDGYSANDPAMDDWYERQHEKNDRYRESYDSSNFRDTIVDIKHMTNSTEDSLDAPFIGKATAARKVPGAGAHAEYIRTPVAVESTVASLLDPSILSEQSKVERKSRAESLEDLQREEHGNYREMNEDVHTEANEHAHQAHHVESFEDLKEYRKHVEANSPRQSVTRSLDDRDERIDLGASALPILDDPMPEIGNGLGSDSDLTTNPSYIRGPIGGVHHDSRDNWPGHPTPPQSKNDPVRTNERSTHESLKAAAVGMLSAAALAQQEKELRESGNRSREMSLKEDIRSREYNGANHNFEPVHDAYMNHQTIPTPPMTRDEGYISANNPGLSPEPKLRNAGAYDRGIDGIDDLMKDDPFVNSNNRARHLSANSHGMPSPLYDSATGGGIDRIQSKDIVALMDHLTVRDAQRNARDTEILVTLVRSAAEMRNSFEDMKRFIADQDEMLIDTGNKQHDRTIQKVIGGPRPQPIGTPRAPRRASADDDYMDDMPAKRRNVFKRALKGLGGRNSNDLGKIEDMFLQLLGEMEALKAGQDIRPSANGTHPGSLSSYDNLRAAGPDGYEPEGQAGTSSTGNHSGYFSNPPSKQPSGMRGNEGRRGSQNRISTVLEGDEDLEDHEQNVLDHQFANDGNHLTPTREFPRGGSVPLDTPPQVHIPTGAQSNEHTPMTGTDRSRKHKSSSSSFLPKISRWSKTTASSVGDNFRGTARKERPVSEASRSGSEGQYNTNENYDPRADDRLRSNNSLDNDAVNQENRPSSPLIPSQVSERPKYQAQRDSLNLQHPQPRIGPTQRYHHQLESQAHNFGSPISPTSDQWGSNPSLARFAPGPGNRHSGGAGNLSPISDAGYSDISAANQTSTAPPRPPKVRDDGPLIPVRPIKSSGKDTRPTFASPISSEHLAPEQRYSNGSLGSEQANGSPRSASNSVPQRKPTGPRPITSSGSFNLEKAQNGIKPNRYRGSPNHVGSPTEDAF